MSRNRRWARRPLLLSAVLGVALAGTGCLPERAGSDGGGDAVAAEESASGVGLADAAAVPPEDVMSIEPEPAFVPDPDVPAFTVDKTAEVSVLCYHDFTTGKSVGDMQIEASEFRTQMQALHDAGLEVISLDQFLAWRAGEGEVPHASVLITIDDGWKSVHEIAFPILKEFGYPFVVFLYARYVNGGGRALTVEEIGELVAGGAAVGSHSFSHPAPSRVRAAERAGEEQNEAFIVREMERSKGFLEEKLGVPVRAYAYAGGIFTERMIELNAERGWYDALFTINPAKCRWDTEAARLNRYVIHAGQETNFRKATTFSGRVGSALDLAASAGVEGGAPVAVVPEDRSRVGDRLPLIAADLSAVEGLEPASVGMTVSGFGEVPARFDPETGEVSWRPTMRLRESVVQVVVTFRRRDAERPEARSWSFEVDPTDTYLEVARKAVREEAAARGEAVGEGRDVRATGEVPFPASDPASGDGSGGARSGE